jgi:DNA ligase-1
MQISQWYDEDFGHWCTIDSFNDIVSTVRRKEADTRWNEIVLAVFDYVTDDDTTYRERYEKLWCVERSRSPSFLVPIEGTMEEGEAPMGEGWLLEAKYRGWEGIMLRNPDASYERKRTRNLLKVKPVVDEEFTVVDVQAGTGKHEGRMGALVCERDGETFKVGTGFTDADREQSDWVGKTITVEYFELTPRGVPRHPRFKGVRDYE